MLRLFFALWPDNRQRDQLRDVINSVARDVEGKAVDRRLWHITVAYIGQVDEKLVPELPEETPAIPFSRRQIALLEAAKQAFQNNEESIFRDSLQALLD